MKTSPFIEFGPRHVWLNEIKPFESEREEGEGGEREGRKEVKEKKEREEGRKMGG